MNPTSAVLTALVIQQGLFALVLATMAVLRLARRASWHWFLGVVLISAGLVLVVRRDALPTWVGYWVANLAVFAGFVAVLRGVEVFSRRRLRNGQLLGALLAYAALMGAMVRLDLVAWWVLAANLPLSLVLIRTAWIVRHELEGEFGLFLARLCAAPLLAIALLLGVRALLGPLMPEFTRTSIHAMGPGNLGLALALVGAGLLLNLSLVALVCARVLRRLHRASQADDLTGLLNRRGIEQMLRLQSQALARHGRPFSVLSIDVDHFKRINDRYGHPVGDEVLRSLGRTLRETCREIDLPARTGGEEFWVVMPDTALDGARRAAERMLQAVRQQTLAVGTEPLTVTVSIGVATAATAGEPLEELMRRLDAALYRAKGAGRNRIEEALAA